MWDNTRTDLASVLEPYRYVLMLPKPRELESWLCNMDDMIPLANGL